MNRNSDEFLHRFSTVVQIWVHLFTPEMKEQSTQWIVNGEPVPKKAKSLKSAEKVMATVSGMHAVSYTLITSISNNNWTL